jgi:hypothetical protein
VSTSLKHQHAVRVLGLHLVLCALLSGCAGGHEAGPASPEAATGEARPATETTSSATTATARQTTSVEAGTQPPHRHAFWSLEKLIRRLAGSSIRIEGRAVRLDAGTLTCWGDGAGRRFWTHFSCIQPRFPHGQLAGPDALFHAHATGQTSFLLTDASFGRY